MILLYHSVVPNDNPPERWAAGQALTRAAFERQILWLARHHQIVSLKDYADSMKQPRSAKRKPIAITFDDGFDVTFRCTFPILSGMNIPATIFVSTGHLENGELLWFSYLKALCFSSQYATVNVEPCSFPLQKEEQRKSAWDQLRILAKNSGDPSTFCRRLSRTYPLDPDVKSLYAGMTYKQIKMTCESDLLELGAHTVTHPFLGHLSREKQEKEIVESKNALSELTKKEILFFAYPAGEYNNDTLKLMKTAGFRAAFAVIPQKIGTDPTLEIARIGIYSPSLLKLQMKTVGFADLGRFFGLKVG